jgi:hypothetical protein
MAYHKGMQHASSSCKLDTPPISLSTRLAPWICQSAPSAKKRKTERSFTPPSGAQHTHSPGRNCTTNVAAKRPPRPNGSTTLGLTGGRKGAGACKWKARPALADACTTGIPSFHARRHDCRMPSRPKRGPREKARAVCWRREGRASFAYDVAQRRRGDERSRGTERVASVARVPLLCTGGRPTERRSRLRGCVGGEQLVRQRSEKEGPEERSARFRSLQWMSGDGETG